MFELKVTGKTYKELQDNLRAVLGDEVVERQQSFVEKKPLLTLADVAKSKDEQIGAVASLLAQEDPILNDIPYMEKPKRTRRTKAEMEAVRQEITKQPDPVAIPAIPAIPEVVAPVVPVVSEQPVPVTNIPRSVDKVGLSLGAEASPTKMAHTFESFRNSAMTTMSKLVNEKKIDQAYLNTLKGHYEVKEIWEIFKDDKKMRDLYENFCSFGLIERVNS